MSHAAVHGHPHDDGHDLPEYRDRVLEVSVRGTRITIKRTQRCSACQVYVDMGTNLSPIALPTDVRGWRDLIGEAFGPYAARSLTDAITDYFQDHANLRWHFIPEPYAWVGDPACRRATVINKTSDPQLVNCGNCRRTRAFRDRWARFKADGAPWAQEDPIV